MAAWWSKSIVSVSPRHRRCGNASNSGFNVHRSRRVLPDERADLERLAQYIIRNPFTLEKIVSLIDDRAVIERILRHLGLWEQGVRVSPSTGPPAEIVERVIPPSPVGYGGQAEPWLDDPFPDYDTEPVMKYANG